MEQYVEVAIYRLKSGITNEQFLQTAVATHADFQKIDGFIRHDLFEAEDGRWLDMVYYDSRQAAKTAETVLTAAPNIQTIMSMLDIEEDNFFHVSPAFIAESNPTIICRRLEQFYCDVGANNLPEAMELFAADASIMGPGQAPITGKAAIQAWWASMLEQYDVQATPAFDEVADIGNAVVLRGKALGTLISRTGDDSVPVDSWFMQIYRQQDDGTFRFWRGSFGPNPPPQN